MRNRLRNRKHLIWIAPLAIVGIAIFIFIGGEIVKVLWNWLAPSLFGLKLITFWQALGLLVLCRILFGGFGMSGNASRRSRRQMFERWEQMTPEERERFRQRLYGRAGRTSPLDSNETA
jgi:uncharacterized membrane protein